MSINVTQLLESVIDHAPGSDERDSLYAFIRRTLAENAVVEVDSYGNRVFSKGDK